jgi:signal transduction histidine kinase
MEKRYIHKRGHVVYGILDVTLVRDDDDQPSYFIGSVVDITERKQAEEEREKLQNQLLQAQKMESVGRLAGGVAHDLNNMLLAILGYSEMLLADPKLDTKYKKQIELMHQAGLRSRDLVRQLLAFSRKQTLEMEGLDVNRVLSVFQKLLQKTIRENIEIEYELSSYLPSVQADRNQLEQVILNLAVNAQDAMPEGGTLTIETKLAYLDERYAARHLEVVPGRYVQLMVSDTGQGMDKKIQEHIFEPFFTTKKLGEGTGLGLSTVYGIVKQHRGDIWVYSEPGRGTTFKIYLPVSEGIQQWSRPSSLEKKRGIRGQETVFVVEDNDMVRDLTVSFLKDQGYNVLCAANGSQCLDLLRTHKGPIDLLLTDVIIPDMNGKVLYEQVAKSFPESKVLYMSGYTENVICHHGVLDDGVAFLQKPFSIHDLYVKVREVFDRE